MSGELQTIPARHGVATYVPKGRTIKVVNTYGKQVVSMWAFSLNGQPEKEKDEDKELEKIPEAELQEDSADDPPEEAPEETADDPPEEAPDEKPAAKKPWSSYLPSMPYRSKKTADDEETEKPESDEMSKSWSSYLPTGKGFSTNFPDVKIPDSKGVVSAFKASHYRDPNKSYAEQLYDFSKTPVGAGTIAAATGSGTASSLYAAYTAYTKLAPSRRSQPPMEYLSIPHTLASTYQLSVPLNKPLLTNLRAPILTLVEDTSSGSHSMLTAACDANLYSALGVEKPEEHGSCAENLVLALKELNERVGLKGQKAVGADVTVNNAPTPVHLFMNTPIETGEGGKKEVKFQVDEPEGKKRSYVRWKAERDVVIVMSACPMDVGKQNGGKCMAANFVVEAEEETRQSNSATPVSSAKKRTSNPSKLAQKREVSNEAPKPAAATPKPMPTPKGGPNKFANRAPIRRDSAAEEGAGIPPPASPSPVNSSSPSTPRKKPKKLERRAGSGTVAKSEAATPSK